MTSLHAACVCERYLCPMAGRELMLGKISDPQLAAEIRAQLAGRMEEGEEE